MLPVEITHEYLQRFTDGVIEVHNPFERYLYRGKIKDIALQGDVLCVVCGEVEKAKGYPPLAQCWTRDETMRYDTYNVQLLERKGYLEPSSHNSTLIINVPEKHERVVLYERHLINDEHAARAAS